MLPDVRSDEVIAFAPSKKQVKPVQNNSFKHEATGLTFIIPSDKQVKPAVARDMVDRWTAKEKNRLLANWKAKPRNLKWRGDENTKKKELFDKSYASRRASINILVERRSPDKS